MSTIKVNNLEPPNVGETVAINGLNMPTAGPLSNRNKIHNGDMRISQRNFGVAISSNVAGSNWAVDRTQAYGSVAGRFSCQQNQGGVTPPTGFTNYVGVTALSNTAPGTNEPNVLQQGIEGYNIADLNWGTANAKPVIVSFWVRANNTGNYSVALRNGVIDFHYATTYTIHNVDTWEYKTVSFPGPTTGTWYTDNRAGILLDFDLGSGSYYESSSPNTWNSDGVADEKYTVAGAQKTVGTAGRYLYFTGVQLEAGEKATPFEHRSYGDELQRCERYFQTYGPIFGLIFSNYSATDAYAGLHLRTEMRVGPSVYHLEPYNSTHLNYYSAGGVGKTLGNFGLNVGTKHMCQFIVQAPTNGNIGAQGDAAHLDINQTNAIQLQAEL